MRLLKIHTFAVVLGLFLADGAHAQLMCSLGAVPARQGYDPLLDQPPSPRAAQELQHIYNVLCPSPYGCGQSLLVMNSTATNALAIATGPGQSKIAYDPTFMTGVEQQFGGGATFGILAHEFGHHIDFHTTPPWMNTSWSRELKADAWAGCALAKTGVPTGAIENALRAIAQYPSPSHPAWPQRHHAVRTGFVSCGGQWLNSYGSPGSMVPPNPPARVCQTNFGTCQLMNSVPVGSPCVCTGVGPFGGMLQQPGIAR